MDIKRCSRRGKISYGAGNTIKGGNYHGDMNYTEL